MDAPSLHQLRLFLEIVRQGSFTRAAEALVMSQPAVSAQMARLERRYGQPLLERLPRGIRLTQAGELLADYAERMSSLSTEMEAALDDLRGVRRGRLTVGASSTIGEYLLPPLIGRFLHAYPGVNAIVRVANTAKIVDEVARRQIDLGFVGDVPDDITVVAEPIGEDEIVPLVAADHPMATQAEVPLWTFLEAGLIAREAGSATRATAERSVRAAGLEPAVIMELGSNEAVKRAVRAGLGAGLLSRQAVDSELAAGHLAIVNVAGWSCRRQLYAIHRRDKRLLSAEIELLRLARASASYRPPSL